MKHNVTSYNQMEEVHSRMRRAQDQMRRAHNRIKRAQNQIDWYLVGFWICANFLGTVKEKLIRKTCFFREKST